MKTIFFVTTNPNKLEEARKVLELSNLKIEPVILELPEVQHFSQEYVVTEKLKHAYKKLKKPVFVDDTGIYFSNYADFPGTMTKFVVNSLKLEGIMRLIDEGSKAVFRTLVGFTDGKKTIICEGKLEGQLTKKIPTNVNPIMPFSSIFVPFGEKQTLSQLGDEYLKHHSHRSIALVQLKERILTNGKSE